MLNNEIQQGNLDHESLKHFTALGYFTSGFECCRLFSIWNSHKRYDADAEKPTTSCGLPGTPGVQAQRLLTFLEAAVPIAEIPRWVFSARWRHCPMSTWLQVHSPALDKFVAARALCLLTIQRSLESKFR